MSEGVPDLEDLRRDLRSKYPTLHAFGNTAGHVEIAGAFVVRGTSGEELGRYSISIMLLPAFPDKLPIVRETGGRIPWHEDRHVERDGRACVMIEEDRWRCFPAGSSILDFIAVPVANFFLSQSYFEEHGEWPLGEWKHGWSGVLQYYQWLIGTEDNLTVCRFLYIISRLELKTHLECPCGSGKKIKRCCRAKIVKLRRKIPWQLARERFKGMGVGKPYHGSKLLSERQTPS
jgi:hypothetical protein